MKFIDKYEIVDCIGTGSFGTIHKTFDIENKKVVALKKAKDNHN